jgi:hypothetical protein
MRPITVLSLRVAAILGGSALIGAGLATHPATAQNIESFAKQFAIVTCSNSSPCQEYKNNGSGAGVEGVANSGNGVIAKSTSGSAMVAASTYSDGTQSYSNNNDGTNSGTANPSITNGRGRSGVWGHDDSSDGGTLNVGVAGSSTNGTGVSGASTNGVGVNGASTHNYALAVSSSAFNYTMLANGNTCGGCSGADIRGAYLGIVGRAPAGGNTFPIVLTDSNGNDLDFTDGKGDLFYHGSLLNFAYAPHGNIAWSYGATAASPSIEDTGAGQLVNGIGTVHLDPAFAQAIDQNQAYHVMLTPDADTRGLYVASKSPTEFVVREVQGGRGTLSFDYHIYAPTLGHANERMAITTRAQAAFIMPKAMPLSSPVRSPR